MASSRLQNLEELESVFWAVSDPQSSAYGQHLSLAEVDRRFGAPVDAVAAVRAWLAEAGVEVRGASVDRGVHA